MGVRPPSRHQQKKEFRLNWPLEIGEAKIVWWLFWWLLLLTVVCEHQLRRIKDVEAPRVSWQVGNIEGGDSEGAGKVREFFLIPECHPSLVGPRQPEGAPRPHPSYGFSKHRQEALRS